MEVKTTPPSLENIFKQEYARYANLYRPYVAEAAQPAQLELTAKLRTQLEIVPQKHRDQVIAFARRVASRVPEQVFQNLDLAPTNRLGLKALVALAYNADEEAKSDPAAQEHYIRALIALSNPDVQFGNGLRLNSQEATEEYFERDFSSASFFNFVTELTAATLPIENPSPDYHEAQLVAYETFLEKCTKKYAQDMQIFREHVSSLRPEKANEVEHLPTAPLFANVMNGLKTFSNDVQLGAENGYSALSIGALASGIDNISGLPLTIAQLPSNYRLAASNEPLSPNKDPVYKSTSALVHENVHLVESQKDVAGDWLHLVNELLTDTTTRIITLQTEGQDFVNCPPEYNFPQAYYKLVRFARVLVAQGLFSEDELMRFGFRQNPKEFLAELDERIHKNPDAPRNMHILHYLESHALLPLIKHDARPERERAFLDHPSAFLEEECIKMWKTLKGEYLGLPITFVKIVDEYRSRHPDRQVKSIDDLIGEDGVFPDDVVDIFNDVISGQGEFRHTLFTRDELQERLDQDPQEEYFSQLDVPPQFQLDEETDDVHTLVDALNIVLFEGLGGYKVQYSKDQLYAAVLTQAKDLYQRTIAVLEKNWGSQGIAYSKGDVFTLLRDLVPLWLPIKDALKEPEKITQKVIDGLDTITQPGTKDHPGFTPDQMHYWGPALEVVTSDP